MARLFRLDLKIWPNSLGRPESSFAVRSNVSSASSRLRFVMGTSLSVRLSRDRPTTRLTPSISLNSTEVHESGSLDVLAPVLFSFPLIGSVSSASSG